MTERLIQYHTILRHRLCKTFYLLFCLLLVIKVFILLLLFAPFIGSDSRFVGKGKVWHELIVPENTARPFPGAMAVLQSLGLNTMRYPGLSTRFANQPTQFRLHRIVGITLVCRPTKTCCCLLSFSSVTNFLSSSSSFVLFF